MRLTVSKTFGAASTHARVYRARAHGALFRERHGASVLAPFSGMTLSLSRRRGREGRAPLLPSLLAASSPFPRAGHASAVHECFACNSERTANFGPACILGTTARFCSKTYDES